MTAGKEPYQATSSPRTPAFFYKILRVFTDIKPGEALTAFLLMLNVYLLFVAYYIIKPVRDALMLRSFSAETKLYLSAVIAVLLIFVVKVFSRIASRVPRHLLITWVTLFFISNLVLFYALYLGGIGPGAMGIIFYCWGSIFNLIAVAQFWGFATDIYTEEAGKRLIPLVAFGATFGGFSGGKITNRLVVPLGTFQLMLIAAGILAVCILLTWIIHRREVGRLKDSAIQTPASEKKEQEKPLLPVGAFRLIFRVRYLLYIALFVAVLNFVNTNGQYILDTVAKQHAASVLGTAASVGLDKGQVLTQFYAGFNNIMNLFAMFVQLFVVSRVFKWFGVRMAIFILPVMALGGYFLLSFGAAVLLVKWVKALENGTDYSLMNTTRHALFLITTREEKYKAQAATKTFFHRSGDVLSALLVFVGTTFLAFKVENVAMANVILVLVWLLLGFFIYREHKRLSAERQPVY